MVALRTPDKIIRFDNEIWAPLSDRKSTQNILYYRNKGLFSSDIICYSLFGVNTTQLQISGLMHWSAPEINIAYSVRIVAVV